MNIAVILAGGTGSRFGTGEPKQFALIGDRTVLEHSVAAFTSSDFIDEICIVSHPNWKDRISEFKFQWPDEKLKIIAGGSERYMSSLNAIMSYIDYPDDTNLLFHDAARPNVSKAVIESVLRSLDKYEAVGVGVPATDTLWEVAVTNEAMEKTPDQPWCLLKVPERKRYWMAQTPQGFRLPVIRDAYQRALQDPNFAATDDCGVVSRYMPEIRVHLVKGSPDNIKVTFACDMQKLNQNVN